MGKANVDRVRCFKLSLGQACDHEQRLHHVLIYLGTEPLLESSAKLKVPLRWLRENSVNSGERIWDLVAEHFPDAIQIVDLYHARQHLREVARQLIRRRKSNRGLG